MSRGGSRRGGDRGEFSQQGVDGWAVAGNGGPRAPPKVGDLSNFGKINKTTAMTFGPSSVFAGENLKEGKRESISRTSSSSNMFSMLQSTEPLSNFGKINKTTAMTFGPSSVFAGKNLTEGTRESISRTSSSSNMFSMLQSTEPPAEAARGKDESLFFCFSPTDFLPSSA